MVFQHLNVWPHLTVLENLTLAPRLARHMSRQGANDRAMEILTRMGIEAKAAQYPYGLAGGQQQRVALARALLMDPQILILDEITSALDPELVGEILDIIAELATGGITMLIVTHEVPFASEVANRVVFMDEGRVVEEGKPEALLERPQTLRLQTFLERVTRHRLMR